MIKDLITNKNAKERAQIKSREIAKLDFSGLFQNAYYGIDTQIIGEVKEIQGGIEFFAKAWKNGKPLGFGKDGSVEIERFRIFNPPILINAFDGDIIQEFTNEITKIKKIRKLKENPTEAIRQSLAHTIGLVSKENSKIIKGKIGNTTSTFYPDASVETTSVDGYTQVNAVDETWATIHDRADGTLANDSDANQPCSGVRCSATSNQFQRMERAMYLFDTSAIPDGDTISSAILSLCSQTKWVITALKVNINIYASTPASNTAIATGDFDQYGTTAFSTQITYDNWAADGTYNDFTLNASGLTAISKTGISKFGSRDSLYDAPNSAPTWSSGDGAVLYSYTADNAGTTNDPKLVVVHTTPITVKGEFFQLF